MINKKWKILIVEDDKAIRNVMQFCLKQENFELMVAGDGEEGLEMVNKQMPDLILLDLILPKINGFEFLKRLREDKKTRSLPVMVFSNLSQKGDVDLAREYGAIDFFVKSDITTNDLSEIVNKYFNQKI